MEDLEYSCEKCNGKSATVLHKFSRLPRSVFCHFIYFYRLVMKKSNFNRKFANLFSPSFNDLCTCRQHREVLHS